MKISMIKHGGGLLIPVSELEAEKLSRIKTMTLVNAEIKQPRNHQFHKKVFAFFNFCFEHWQCENDCFSHQKQFDVFRAQLTVLAGYYDTYHKIGGGVRVEAKSISYSAMTQDDFEQFFIALTNTAMKHIFKSADENIYTQLIEFFK